MKLTRYLVVKLEIETDMHVNDLEVLQEIDNTVANELDYKIEFSGKLELNDDETISIRINNTEVEGMTSANPL